MENKRTLKLAFMGGRQAGLIGVITAMAAGCEVLAAVGYSKELVVILKSLGIPVYDSIDDKRFIKSLTNVDLLLSVHGRQIVKPQLLRLPRLGAVNIHPYLYKYKGSNPVGRALKDKEFKASVAAHVMEEKIDSGEVLVEEFVDVSGAVSVDEIYNKLYPCYSLGILKALRLITYAQKL
ncbi:MAG: hypothetical protein COZ98_00445 [Candidatus Omnitrophica bacterium CG_4_8_14_3_um_filter_43_15]|nr:MAG: hypothetical protein AUJ89_04395 [Candidatus Omnitrophica bacterium CG1_02_43_210]PIV39591.1 MAG: hypothetical protein COS29_01835 [Candidatus Omnitrophica bacterium CG02_land_8_20_14_3_00__42_8]PIW67136.1 MAG: hypothetical protein COW10_07250 [Candidatus Omnitrophica bacterium CG12_big_fil_rev_8_21_14_0_65_42_8]PIW80832.1 MAG: hypothetical protein COZ98_00445 [Candidatus Omnitrophica bacterium CG_4_8_14_3_um_filter_43_15]